MFDRTRGKGRERIDRDELEKLQRTGSIIVDDRRRRPLYFDGRFLAARDLIREQGYFLSRQADLGRAGGAGVVDGLMVERGATATSLRIDAGHGITSSGESVVLPSALTVQLADLAEMQRLDGAFGLLPIPREPARARSGLFVVALRPVEFTANPIASYPTAITGDRSVEDGDIIEGVAITLIPYPDEGARNELGMRRARAAYEIFLQSGSRGSPATALPLAMVALNRGMVEWVDPFLVRRELGAGQRDVLGLSSRALREAQLLQYENHLHELLAERASANQGRRFAAAEHFLALPPAGRIPAAAINPADFSQIFFPAEVGVEISIVPEDEIPVLLEESLLLPPIDLSQGAGELDSTSVLVLVPVARQRMRMLNARLESLTQTLRPAAPSLVAHRSPLEMLRNLRSPRDVAPGLRPETVVDAAWRELLSSAELLWYVRRRNLHYRADVVGVSTRIFADEIEVEERLLDRLEEVGLRERFTGLETRATAAAYADMVALLASPTFTLSRTMVTAALRELEEAETLDQPAVLTVAERFADPRLGEGLLRLERVNPEMAINERIIGNLASSGTVPQLDRLVRTLDDVELAEFAAELERVARRTPRTTPGHVAELVSARLRERTP
jgi:hypothetical protein